MAVRQKCNNNEFNISFSNNQKDLEECFELYGLIKNSGIISQLGIDSSICKEISEYATGHMIKCRGLQFIYNTCLNTPARSCAGSIHYLRGDNFVANSFSLFNYACDLPSDECTKLFHVFHCEYCDDTFETNAGVDIYPNRACSCGKIYCEHHWQNNGVYCEYCSKFFCADCASKTGMNCNGENCNNFFCSDCFIDEEDEYDASLVSECNQVCEICQQRAN